jgi:hypothetical protein
MEMLVWLQFVSSFACGKPFDAQPPHRTLRVAEREGVPRVRIWASSGAQGIGANSLRHGNTEPSRVANARRMA